MVKRINHFIIQEIQGWEKLLRNSNNLLEKTDEMEDNPIEVNIFKKPSKNLINSHIKA